MSTGKTEGNQELLPQTPKAPDTFFSFSSFSLSLSLSIPGFSTPPSALRPPRHAASQMLPPNGFVPPRR